ncbi:MAG: hypothetical protein M9938_03455 [Solirubrobacterales bacterium]|nr:hypothetical protein [Solirubrobacterales bacterium]
MELRLEANGAFDPDANVAPLSRHAIRGLEDVDPERREYARLLRVHGKPRPVRIRLDRDGVLLRTENGDRAVLDELIRIARFWFDLDRDLEPVEAALGADPLLGPAVRRRPGLRIVRYPDGFEAAVRVVLGQQVSVAAGNTFAERLLRALGRRGPGGLAVFPEPEWILDHPTARLREQIGLTRARTATLKAVAELFASGFRLGPGVDPGAARKRLLAVPGVGPWTAGYLSIRGLDDPDAFPPGDAVLRRALNVPSDREAVARAAGWSPWRSYAAVHLWQQVTA